MKRVFVNGYGSIGRRIASFVAGDTDVEVIGVGRHSPRGVERASGDGFDVYVPQAREREFDGAAGTIESALDAADLVIDCSPGGRGYDNKVSLYAPRSLKAIYQGGETIYGERAVSDLLFNSRVNYAEASSRDHVMQGSCNVTGIGKILGPLKERYGARIVRADIALLRRWSDLEHGGEVPDTVEITRSPHHGDDVRSYMGDATPLYVRAVKVPSQQMHLHILDVRFEGDAPPPDEIHGVLGAEEAVAVVWGAAGTRDVRQFADSMGFCFGDTNMAHVHADVTASRADTLQVFYSDDQTGIVIPENHMLMQAMLFDRPYAEAVARTRSLFRLGERKAALESRFAR